MNDAQFQRFTERVAEYSTRSDLTSGVKSLIQTLSCVEIEEEMLQAYCNENGTCYMVTGKSGDVYSRARPEWQQLKEARMRKQAMIATLERLVGTTTETTESVDEFFG
jgi:hypothetical protein